jgi:hypothetical protein
MDISFVVLAISPCFNASFSPPVPSAGRLITAYHPIDKGYQGQGYWSEPGNAE